ncbi:MAG: oligosaccharide flippase family protein [Candidatus Firestonebacteria bacterium]
MKFTEKSLVTLISRVFAAIINLIAGVLLARALGPSGRGEYALLLLAPSILSSIANFGINTANVYFIAKKKHNLRDTVINSIAFSVIFGLIFTIIFLLFFDSFYIFFKGVTPQYLILAVVILPVLLIHMYFNSILIGRLNMLEFNIVTVVQPFSLLALLYIFIILLQMGVKGAFISWTLSYVVPTVLMSVFLMFQIKSNKDVEVFVPYSFSKQIGLMKELLQFGVKSYIANLASFLSYRIDMLFVNLFLDVATVGYYSISVMLAEMIWYIPNSFALILYPVVSSSDSDTANKLTVQACKQVLLFVSLAAILLFLFGKQIILLLFGKNFTPSIQPLLFLLPGIIALSVDKVLSSFITGKGRPEISGYIAGTNLVVNIGLNIFLIPKFGIIGASISSSISYSIAGVMSLIAFLRISKK